MALLVLKIAGAIVLLDILVQAGFARAIISHFERKPKLRARAYPPRRDAERFSVASVDGPLLRGSVLRATGRSTDGVIVFCHEFGGSRWSFQGHCADHVTERHDLVTFDFRNHGESDHDRRYTPCHWLTRFEVHDVEAVLEWVATRPEWRGLPVTLVGVSRGANAALAAAAGSSVHGVVAVGAFSTLDLAMHHLMAGIRRLVPAILAVPLWHIRSTLRLAIAWSGLRQRVRFVPVEQSVQQLGGRPVLMLAGGDDSHVPESFQRLLADRIPQATFWTVPGGRHNLERDASPEEFDDRVRGFLTAVTGDPAPSASRELASAA
ncbi:Alpha/beta hydrolase family protein [Caulifigura coniformis]|uniref:Alpha/beta hydrolase family protein n=1 Tax=Caulifigura coniformis TaxID=2527983 RepID=A0A517S990_9PLAN|nr:alpha/beta fold hydrolase [Caulifigura coniformis]QDT52700.1 Alpha/beta hydrolase family protein [Caulifigura coniformis]